MTQAVILHTVRDANHCIKHGLHKEATLFSTNVNVVYYLKYHCDMECQSLEDYLDPKDNYEIQNTASELAGSLLKELDQYLAPQLNELTGLNIRYFEPLYSFTSARQLSIYMLLACCLRGMFEQYSFDKVLVYGWTFELGESLIETFLSSLFPQINLLTIRYESGNKMVRTAIGSISINEIAGVLQHDEGKLPDGLIKQRSSADKNIVVYEPVDRLRFLLQENHGLNVYCYNSSVLENSHICDYKVARDIFPSEPGNGIVGSAEAELKPLLLMLYNDICDDFCSNIVQYLQILVLYKRLHAEFPISAAFWETLPLQGAITLLFEYLLTNQVTRVIGVQSRQTFLIGQMMFPKTTMNRLDQCHVYLTQGFTNEDLQVLYPDEQRKPRIVPQNSVINTLNTMQTGSSEFEDKRKKAGLAVYLKPTLSFLQTGIIPAHAKIDESLFNFLSLVKTEEVHVITSNNPTFENCAMLSLLKRLENVHLVRDAGMHNYLKKYNPELILIDAPTQFIDDMLGEDVRVIMVEDSLFSFSNKALEKLKKRVHYATCIEEAERLLQIYYAGNLENKKDPAYMLHFSVKADLQESVFQFINQGLSSD